MKKTQHNTKQNTSKAKQKTKQNTTSKTQHNTTSKTKQNTTLKQYPEFYQKAIKEWQKNPFNDKSIYNLANIIVSSMLKKIYQASANKYVDGLRKSKADALHNLQKIDYINSQKPKTSYNNSGDIIVEHYQADNTTISTNIQGDGFDLVQDCAVLLLEYAKECEQKKEKINLCKPIYKKVISKKVFIGDDFITQIKENITIQKTTRIQEIYRTLRKELEKSRTPKNITKYSYDLLKNYINSAELDNDLKGVDTDISELLYRLPKYYDLGQDNPLYSGYVASNDYLDIKQIIQRLNLTSRQSIILQFRLQGLGYRQIADILNIKHPTIVDHCKKIQKKVEKIGLKPTIQQAVLFSDFETLKANITDIRAYADRLKNHPQKNRKRYIRKKSFIDSIVF